MTRGFLAGISLLTISLWGVRAASAEQQINGSLEAEFVSNYDADTLTVNLPSIKHADSDGSMEVFWKNISVRIIGVDAPEMKGDCPNETKKAKAAQKVVQGWLKKAKHIELVNPTRDKYFRLLAEVQIDGQSVGDMLLEQGIAFPYDGGARPNHWCN